MDAGVDAAILKLAETGAVTATSVMVCPARWPEAARALGDAPPLSIGLHLDLTSPFVDGEFPAQKLPRLMAAAQARLLRRAALRREVDRQLSLFEKGMGRAPDFADGHQHIHHFPVISGGAAGGARGPLRKGCESHRLARLRGPAMARRESRGYRADGCPSLCKACGRARPQAELRFRRRLRFRGRCQSSCALAKLGGPLAGRTAAHHVPRCIGGGRLSRGRSHPPSPAARICLAR